MSSHQLSSCLMLLVLGACSAAPDETFTESSEALGRDPRGKHDGKHGEKGKHDGKGRKGEKLFASSTEFANPEAFLPAGIAADSDLLFVGAPLEGRVMVLSRRTRQQIAELPVPPGGFVLPFILHTIGKGRLTLLDAGGFPSPGVVDASPTLYEYAYSYRAGSFDATLSRTVSFAGKRIGFAEDFVHLGSGRYLLADAIYGSIWTVGSNGEIRPGIVPKTFERADAIPELAYCPTMPQITVGGLPFLFTGSTIPGITGIDVRDGTVYFSSPCAGAVYKLPLSSLFDSRPPWKRARDIELVSKKPKGVAVEELLETQFNPFDRSDPHLYAADALELRLIRIDTRNGKREVVGDDPRLFNFPSSLAFAQPKPGEKASLFVLSNQQHRTPLLNEAITEDVTEPPYVVTQVVIPAGRSGHRHHD